MAGRAERGPRLNTPRPATASPVDWPPWTAGRYTRLRGFRAGEHGYRALATTPDGDPLVIEGPLGKGRIILALGARPALELG